MTTEKYTLIKATTILAVSHGKEHDKEVVLAGDGQVTLGESIVKHGANKLRELAGGKIVAGFAGSAADSFTLFERFDAKLEQYGANLARASVELAKDWRQDKYLRRLEAMLLAADHSQIFVISGAGDVIQPDDGVMAIGSGGNFALAAARALVRKGDTSLTAEQIATEAMKIASELCPYTNSKLNILKAVKN